MKVDNDFTLGLYKYSITGGDDCKKNVDEINDAALNCGKVCAVLALIFGLIVVVAAIVKQYLFKLPLAQKLLDISSILTQIFLALVYVAWRYVRVRNLRRKTADSECLLTLLPLSNFRRLISSELTVATWENANGARVPSTSLPPRFATSLQPSLPGACANLVTNVRGMNQREKPSNPNQKRNQNPSMRRSSRSKRAKDLTRRRKKTLKLYYVSEAKLSGFPSKELCVKSSFCLVELE